MGIIIFAFVITLFVWAIFRLLLGRFGSALVISGTAFLLIGLASLLGWYSQYLAYLAMLRSQDVKDFSTVAGPGPIPFGAGAFTWLGCIFLALGIVAGFIQQNGSG